MRRILAGFLQFETLLLLLLLVAVLPTVAQSILAKGASVRRGDDTPSPCSAIAPSLACEAATPQVAPELALLTYERHSRHQLETLVSYTATTIVHADLPDCSQHAQFELRTQYIAPKTLRFTPVHFIGDSFVRRNVIDRVLESAVHHVEMQDQGKTAIQRSNYNITYQRTQFIGLRFVYVYAVRPRHKRPGLFKGEIYLDATTGNLLTAKGKMVKSPSFFIRKMEFVQEYTEWDDFTVSIHLHSVANTRLVGRVVVDIFVSDYSPVTLNAKVDNPSLSIATEAR